MKPEAFDEVDSLLIEGRRIDPSFRFYQDALDFIIEKRDRKIRSELIKKYTDDDLDTLLSAKLYPYQKEGVRFAFEKGRCVMADEMGLGKTVQAIAAAEIFRREGLAESVLVVCPTSLKYQWQREIEKFVPGIETLVIEGSPARRREQYNAAAPYKIVSYNCAANDIKLGLSLQSDMLIMDEVQRLKNWKTQISMSARKIVSDYAVILSGTPLENKLEELYTVMEFADNFCLSPYWRFKADCILTDDAGKVIGYQNLNKIGEKVRSRLIRRTKKQVALQMPKRQDSNMLVAMTKEQQETHDELNAVVAQLVLKWRKMHFLSEKDRQRLLLTLSQMRMVCDSTFILDQKTRFDTKIDEAMNILQSVFESGDEKVVIFSQWERMTRLISQELDKLKIGYEYLHGGIPSSKRKDLIKNFSDDKLCRVFLSTDAGSTGLNLQAASIVINLDVPWNPGVLEQRIARVYRLGQERNVQVINLISRGTIEEQMLGKLRFKSAMFEGVLDGGEDTVYLGSQSKFADMMDALSEAVDEEKKQPAAEPTLFSDIETSEQEPENTVSEPEPENIITQGVSFLSGLAKTLKSPEKTAQLVNSLVETDAKTGQTHLRIPVPNKESVAEVLGMLGKLFGK
jgi:SNF2 family DNA or RNA helicase